VAWLEGERFEDEGVEGPVESVGGGHVWRVSVLDV
jgi:hypothetical protein